MSHCLYSSMNSLETIPEIDYVPLCVSVTSDQKRQLKLLSRKKYVPMSAIIKQLLDDYIERENNNSK